jgi:ribosomal protein S18 acetylase RimI-like enzyme
MEDRSDEQNESGTINIQIPKVHQWSEDDVKCIIANSIMYYDSQRIYPKSQEQALKHKYTSFINLPIPSIHDVIGREEVIDDKLSEPNLNPNQLITKTKDGNVIQYYEWDNTISYDDLENFFKDNYYETDKYRISYSKEFIQWALHGKDTFIVGMRRIKDKEIVGVICGRNTVVSTTSVSFDAIEVIFLVILKKVRRKGIAKYLINELYRQIRLKGYGYGIWSSNTIIPKPFAQTNLMVRHINVEKLYTMEFFKMEKDQSISEKITILKILDDISNEGFRKMNINDVEQVWKLYTSQHTFTIYPEFTLDEFKERFMNNIVHCYVIENNNNITDFVSFITYDYKLLYPYNKLHDKLKIALLYYTVFSTKQPISKIMHDVLRECKSLNCDMLLLYDTMENRNFIYEMKFEQTTEIKFMGLVNWKIPNMKANEVGWSMLE